MHEHTILGKKLFFITAHPDDESFLAGGTILKNHKLGGSSTLFCASKGEKGIAYIREHDHHNIKKIREQELQTVAHTAGISEVHVSDLPDGMLESHRAALDEILEAHVQRFAPDFVVSFGADGFTGHRDHIVVGAVARDIATRLGIPFVTFSHPPHVVSDTFKNFFNKKKIRGCYEEKTLIHDPNIHIRVDGLDKLALLKLYKSQFPGLDPYTIFPKDIAEHYLHNEYFIIE